MGALAFYGKVGLMPFLKKHFDIKLTSNGRKQDCTKNISIQIETRKKEKKVRSAPTCVERIYALLTAQQV